MTPSRLEACFSRGDYPPNKGSHLAPSMYLFRLIFVPFSPLLDRPGRQVRIPLPRIAGRIDFDRDAIPPAFDCALIEGFTGVATGPEVGRLWAVVRGFFGFHEHEGVHDRISVPHGNGQIEEERGLAKLSPEEIVPCHCWL